MTDRPKLADGTKAVRFCDRVEEWCFSRECKKSCLADEWYIRNELEKQLELMRSLSCP